MPPISPGAGRDDAARARTGHQKERPAQGGPPITNRRVTHKMIDLSHRELVVLSDVLRRVRDSGSLSLFTLQAEFAAALEKIDSAVTATRPANPF
jgi:hypothetical protein